MGGEKAHKMASYSSSNIIQANGIPEMQNWFENMLFTAFLKPKLHYSCKA